MTFDEWWAGEYGAVPDCHEGEMLKGVAERAWEAAVAAERERCLRAVAEARERAEVGGRIAPGSESIRTDARASCHNPLGSR